MALSDKAKTAFTAKQGLYQFTRMPFGLMNAPSTFQCMMNSVLRGLTWTTCLVYLDDIVIYTRGGIERHILELACVLEGLSSAGLTLKLKKCVFATETMEYLGHELSKEGVRPLDRLVNAVREFPKPTDATEVKRFVHLAGYYRKFVKGFGSMMEPLVKLLRKNVHWDWGSAQDAAFDEVKRVLTTKPVLRYPDF
ncbi:Retrovirus Polyprotein [Phytophthora megakarya]|uniref:Retrovirus Polyprotein n=1 Tax=Phytophthora megakarya TaxID=4795 RepID=A0A225UIW8_9STRA|nr:Retrovirus Polyprotein [Phytophthora megakarya]